MRSLPLTDVNVYRLEVEGGSVCRNLERKSFPLKILMRSGCDEENEK